MAKPEAQLEGEMRKMVEKVAGLVPKRTSIAFLRLLSLQLDDVRTEITRRIIELEDEQRRLSFSAPTFRKDP